MYTVEILMKQKACCYLIVTHQEELFMKSFSALQKNYQTEVEICIDRNKIRLLSSEDEDWVEIERECLEYSLSFWRELKDLQLKFLPAETSFRNLSSPCFPVIDRSPSSFVVKLPHIQITGPRTECIFGTFYLVSRTVWPVWPTMLRD